MYITVVRALVFLQHSLLLYGESLFPLEVENYVMDKFTINRDSSTGYGSINFKTGDSFKIYFCLRAETSVNLNNVRFSNDGGSDAIEFGIDGIRLGILTSPDDSNYGKGWNNFLQSGPIGPYLNLSSGRHFISISVNKTDFYGVELDQLEIKTLDSHISDEIFKCSLFCDKDITYSNGRARDDMSSAVLTRKTSQPVCPSNNNLLLPIYHENVKMFLVTVMHPKYRSFENNFHDEHGLCERHNKTLWEFSKVQLESHYDTVHSELYPSATMEHGRSNTSKSLYMKIKFKNLHVDDTDTRLVLQFLHVVDIFLVTCTYKDEGSLITLKNAYFSSIKTKHVWLIPKNSLLKEREILLHILADPAQMRSITVDFIKLEHHASLSINSENLFSSYDTKIEVFYDQFNKEHSVQDAMSVRNVDTDTIFNHVSEIVISHRLPWADVYSPIVKLLRTGEMNILPIAPHGLTEIPFGTSIVFGQNDPSKNNLPSAPISRIDITPAALQLFVTFKDHGTTNILIKSTWKDTKAIFKDIVNTRNPLKYPFATIMTTWNYDGNADVDHVSSNGDTVHHIVKGWDKLYGTSFTFFRQCLSRYNTQSPDLRLQIINEKDLYLFI